ncbi:hypothetical protein [Vibrio owensii]|uniref:hypothetical protein n=1 Tax=Vibrio harveyi group TaxID=717610 RepID=UPI003CC66EF4
MNDFWNKAVLYKDDKDGNRIESRRKEDELYLIKIRDYQLPIAAFKAVDNVKFPFFYVARGDNLIVATYWDSQVVWEKKVDIMGEWEKEQETRSLSGKA